MEDAGCFGLDAGAGEVIEIPLTQGQIALIDDEDFELVSRYKWFAHWHRSANAFYAETYIREFHDKRKLIGMHRLIFGIKQNIFIDHINCNSLDNRKINLRMANMSQNQCNRSKTKSNKSGYKGVSYRKDNGKWRAEIESNGVRKNLGSFHTPEEAYNAYCDAALRLHGEFARIS